MRPNDQRVFDRAGCGKTALKPFAAIIGKLMPALPMRDAISCDSHTVRPTSANHSTAVDFIRVNARSSCTHTLCSS